MNRYARNTFSDVLRHVTAGFALTALCAGGSAHAANLMVPEQYSTIQAAINAAHVGDTVVVGVGLWYGSGNVNLDTMGKAITIKSISGLGSVILDGGLASPLFNIHSGETTGTVITGFVIRHGSGSAGGGIAINNSGPTISNCLLEFNQSSVNGGGIYSYNSTPTITNCTFLQNSAVYGGGLYVWLGKATVSNCTFEANSTSSWGGALLVQGDTSKITNCAFIGNQAVSGGAVYATIGDNTTFTSCTFNSNTATAFGGGFTNSNATVSLGSPMLFNCTFTNSSAPVGGAVYVDTANPVVAYCLFDSNTATSASGTDGGGAMLVNSSRGTSKPTVYQSSFMNNKGWYGGAIQNSGSILIYSSVFSNNNSTLNGGALSFLSGSPTVVNSIFEANIAAYYGGAIEVGNSGTNATITNSTFASNKVASFAQGDAVYATNNGSASVYNSIVWDNQDSVAHNDLVAYAGATITASFCDVYGGYADSGNINADPIFTYPSGGNFWLNAGSPCLAAGSHSVPFSPAQDIDGTSRSATHPSMGAYEN